MGAVRARVVILNLLGLGIGAFALLGTGDARTLSHRPLVPVRVSIASPGDAELRAEGNLPVTLRATRAVRVRVAPSIRPSKGRAVALTAPVSVALKRGRTRVLKLPLSPPGRAALAGCPAGRVVVTVTGARSTRPRSYGRALRLQPPDCARFFSPATFWNSALPADAALDPDSDALVAELRREVDSGFQSGPAPTINTDRYTPPVYTVAASQPRVAVQLDRPPGEARDLAAAFASVPLPDDVRPSQGTDSDLVLWQPATDTLWEFWQLKRRADGWHAVYGGRLDHVSSGPGVYSGSAAGWGTSASGLPLAGGLITPGELRSGVIDHALAIAIPTTRAGVFASPALRTDGRSNCPHAVPEGARFRLDPALDIDSLHLPPAVTAIARAAQRYGIFVRDQSGSVAFFAQNAFSLARDPYPTLFGGRQPWELLRAFPWSHLQLTKMQLVQAPGDGGSLPPAGDLLSGCR